MKFKLYYFNLKARSEPIRLIFHLADQEFEDVRIKHEDWPNLKPKTPLGHLPYLDIIDGSNVISIGQSTAIARFLAKKFGLVGKNDLQQLFADMYVEQVVDVLNAYLRIYFDESIQDKSERLSRFESNILNNDLRLIDKKLETNNFGVLVGEDITWADLYLFNLVDILSHSFKDIHENYPNIKKHTDKIKRHRRLSEYLMGRIETTH